MLSSCCLCDTCLDHMCLYSNYLLAPRYAAALTCDRAQQQRHIKCQARRGPAMHTLAAFAFELALETTAW